MSGRVWLSDQQREEIGRAVWIGRASGVPWKALERVYGRSRVQLWRLATAWKNETKNPGMKHLGAGHGAARSGSDVGLTLLAS